VQANGLHKTYRVGRATVSALAGVDIAVLPGDYVAITGPSGCGKTTLLSMLGALDRPTAGRVLVGGVDLSNLDRNRMAEVRSRLGFVFQFFNLVPNLTAQENVELGMSVGKVSRWERRRRAERVLDLVNLGHRTRHKPSDMSGGEQQRVAIARALARDPAYLLLDEPTGNLDPRSAAEVLELIDELNRRGTTIIMVTHSPSIARRAHRTLLMADGRLVHPDRVRYG